MHASRRFVVIIGQIPPPTDGLAYITSQVVKLLGEDHDIKVLNISPKVAHRGLAYHLLRTGTVLLASTHLLLNAWRSNRACYMPCQSDFGLVYTIYLLGLARLLRYPTYLHHHNFGYINQRRRMMAGALRAGGANVVHIFLCEHMKGRFGQTYWKPERSAVISNAAFVSPLSLQTSPEPSSSLQIGLLSNLSRDKGLYHFLDLLRMARDTGLQVQGSLAGPVKLPDDRIAIELAQKELGDRLRYLGPIYGEDKFRFYASIDAFVFPTTYANEAQPTVIYEALAAGNLVIAYERGCIASQVKNMGLIIPQVKPFVPTALEYLRALSSDRSIAASRTSLISDMVAMHNKEKERARSILPHLH